jgi:hypothetical protein
LLLAARVAAVLMGGATRSLSVATSDTMNSTSTSTA